MPTLDWAALLQYPPQGGDAKTFLLSYLTMRQRRLFFYRRRDVRPTMGRMQTIECSVMTRSVTKSFGRPCLPLGHEPAWVSQTIAALLSATAKGIGLRPCCASVGVTVFALRRCHSSQPRGDQTPSPVRGCGALQ